MPTSVFEHPDLMYVVILGFISLVVSLIGVLFTMAIILYRVQAQTMRNISISFAKVTDEIAEKLNTAMIDIAAVGREVSYIKGKQNHKE
jgi:hypothetical protein